ncbi:MAG: isopentenyl-diphosphate Delta-isomerase [Bacteroidetes bacterium]|nr:isopentenyl-diphosphate Delta-isomerase [Bacteroidota bacterium]
MKEKDKEEQVVLVDEQDTVLGYMGKQEAHEKGLLHRAISVILFNSQGEQLVQQRAHTKYHWAGIWSNTCCSHPRQGESYQAAAERRLFEELGIKTPLREVFQFIYKAHDEASGLTEHELDHVFVGVFDDDFDYNKNEVAAVRWMDTETLQGEIAEHPENYSFWFKIILEEFKKHPNL